jgi:hypothetical protein
MPSRDGARRAKLAASPRDYDKPAADPTEQSRRSARMGRQLRMLRAHGIIKKVSRTRRYQVTSGGREILTAILTAAAATTAQLPKLAA